MDKIKSITFNKEEQDNLPQHIKDKMKADRDNAEKMQKSKGLNIPVVSVPKGTLCDHDWQFIGSVGHEHCHKCGTWSDICD